MTDAARLGQDECIRHLDLPSWVTGRTVSMTGTWRLATSTSHTGLVAEDGHQLGASVHIPCMLQVSQEVLLAVRRWPLHTMLGYRQQYQCAGALQRQAVEV